MTGRFALVPEWVAAAGLSAGAGWLYVQMAMACDHSTRRLTHGHAALAELTGTSVATVKRNLAELVGVGAVRVAHRRRGQRQTSNLYELPREPQQLTCEPLTDDHLTDTDPSVTRGSLSSSPVSRSGVSDDQEAAAAAAGASPSSSTGALALDDRPDPVMVACQMAAEETGRRERQHGKKISNLPKWAAPRARDFRERHELRLRELVSRGATVEELCHEVLRVETDPLLGGGFGGGVQVESPAGPRLAPYQASLEDTEAWKRQQPVDLAERRAESIADARSALARGRQVVGS